MDRSRLQLTPGLWLDARRAVWLEEHRALLVADTHLGYAWAHRERGNLLPIAAGDDTLARLQTLVTEYAPAELIILGDVIHGSVTAEVVTADLHRLHDLGTHVRLISGNHDRHLAGMLISAGIDSELVRVWPLGPNLLLHGDSTSAFATESHASLVREQAGRIILGHEHPAITLSDGVATSARCPCFVVGEGILVLPAFTMWSTGTDIRAGTFMSPYLHGPALTEAIAILAGKLLRVPL